MPSKDFIDKIKEKETLLVLRHFHKNKVSSKPELIKRLVKIINHRLNIEKDIALLFAKTRLIIRLKCLNKNLQTGELQMRRKNRMHKVKVV